VGKARMQAALAPWNYSPTFSINSSASKTMDALTQLSLPIGVVSMT